MIPSWRFVYVYFNFVIKVHNFQTHGDPITLMIVICKFILKTIPKTISIDAMIKELQNEKERLEQSVLSLQKDYFV